ncbi:MAG: hypothetical protein DWQ02_26040 [Bacteroidetes bacterium]|nr:MAG: hypothetical protein DWQ02_26040 [Bacteroidota bacterium]
MDAVKPQGAQGWFPKFKISLIPFFYHRACPALKAGSTQKRHCGQRSQNDNKLNDLNSLNDLNLLN